MRVLHHGLIAFLAIYFGCGLLLLTNASAQTATIRLTWTAPTTFIAGGAIGTAPISYNVYAGKSSLETLIRYNVVSGVIVPAASPGATLCWQVTAVVAGIESGRSAEVCHQTPAPAAVTPKAPTAVIAQ